MAKTATLVDNFNDTSKDTSKWASTSVVPDLWSGTATGGTIAENGSVLEVAPSNGSDNWNGYSAFDTALDFSESEVVLRVVTRGTADNGILLQVDGGGGIWFEIAGTDITANGFYFGFMGATTATYSSTDHQWLRMRHDTASGGTVYWDTAPDSGSNTPGSWTNFKTQTTSWPATSVTLGFGSRRASGTAGTAQFDNFNTSGGGSSGISLAWITA